jgi:hypothetical protein
MEQSNGKSYLKKLFPNKNILCGFKFRKTIPRIKEEEIAIEASKRRF